MKERLLVSGMVLPLLLLGGCYHTEQGLSPVLPMFATTPSQDSQPAVSSHATRRDLPSSTKRSSEEATRIVLRVGKDVITNTDIAERCRMVAALSHQEDAAEFMKNIRHQVKEKLEEEVIYEQIADRFKLDVSEEMVKAYVGDYALHLGTEPEKFKEALKKYGIHDTFIRLIRSQIIWSYIVASASQKDLLRISEKQIDKEISKIKVNEKKRQYAFSEIVFYSNGNIQAQEIADKTHRELVKMSRQVQPIKAFQTLAQQLSQAPTASDGGYRGWVAKEELELPMRRALERLSLGHFSEPILVRPGEYRILYLNNLKDPGFAPRSQARVELCMVSIPLTPATPSEQQAQIQRRVETLIKCTSKEEFEGVAEDFGYSAKTEMCSLATLPIAPDELKVNACSQPIFTGKSLEIFMLLRRFDPPRSETKVDRKDIRESLEYQVKLVQAKKVVQDFKNRIFIQDYEARSDPSTSAAK